MSPICPQTLATSLKMTPTTKVTIQNQQPLPSQTAQSLKGKLRDLYGPLLRLRTTLLWRNTQRLKRQDEEA